MLALPVLFFMILAAPFYIAKRWEGAKGRAIRAVVALVLVVAAADAAAYLQAAYRRATADPTECKVTGPSAFGKYDALVCVTGGTGAGAADYGFVRLRSTEDGSILAEKEFRLGTYNKTYWSYERFVVGAEEDRLVFELPPPLIDRLRAKLP